jgi:hypothetical protein
MAVQLFKVTPHPATQDRLAEVGQAFQRMADGLQAAAPAFERRLAEVGNSLRSVGKRAGG